MGTIIKKPSKITIKHQIIAFLIFVILTLGMGILGLAMWEAQPKPKQYEHRN